MEYQAENGAARPPKIERGISVAHRKDTKQQRAAKAANVCDGFVDYKPTQCELARSYGVSVTLINRMRKLPLEKRNAVAVGRARLASPERVLALPKPAEQSNGNGKSIDDAFLFDVIATAGTEKVLTIAAAVEAHQH